MKSPDGAQRQQPRDGVPGGDVDLLDLVTGRVGCGEQHYERPVEGAHEQIPDFDRCRRPRAAGFDRVVHDGHLRDRYNWPMIAPLVGSTNSSTLPPFLSIVYSSPQAFFSLAFCTL